MGSSLNAPRALPLLPLTRYCIASISSTDVMPVAVIAVAVTLIQGAVNRGSPFHVERSGRVRFAQQRPGAAAVDREHLPVAPAVGRLSDDPVSR